MRDVHGVQGPKSYVESIEDADVAVRKIYPNARREGSLGAWHWAIRQRGDTSDTDGEVVAEAWIHNRRPGWWLRIKKKEQP